MDFIDYREKLGIGFSDKEKQTQFMARIQVYLQAKSDGGLLSEEQERSFCYEIGVQCKLENKDPFDFTLGDTSPSGFQRIWLYLCEKQKSFPSFLAALVVFANTYHGAKRVRNELIRSIEDALAKSHLPFEKIEDSDGIFFFPAGIPEFDEALVTTPLNWLSKYPKAHTAWGKALKEYADLAEENTSEIADKFRKALETFFREFFSVEKSLENCKAEYGRYLKDHGVPPEITSNFETLLQAYTNYMNGYAKHQDRTSKNVLEYLMYQTGNIIRLLITLKQEAEENAD